MNTVSDKKTSEKAIDAMAADNRDKTAKSLEIDIEIKDNRDKDDTNSNAVMEAIAVGGLSIANQPSMLSNLAYSNTLSSGDLGAKGQVSNQNAQNKLRISILSTAVSRIQNNQPLQARSAVNVLANNELAETIASLKPALAAFTTPNKITNLDK